MAKSNQPAPESPHRRPDISAHRRAQIAEAALRCLKRDGYARLTARRVAEEAGLSLGHLTYHFRDMAEVLAEAYLHVSRQLQEATDSGMGASPAMPRDQLLAFLRAGFEAPFLQPDYLRLRVDLWSAARTDPAIARTEHALYDRYRDQLCALLEACAPAAHQPDIRATSDVIMAMLDGLWLDWLRRGNPVAIAAGLDAAIGLADRLSSKD